MPPCRIQTGERRAFQAAVVLGGFVPVGAGLVGALFGVEMLGPVRTAADLAGVGLFAGADRADAVALDSHWRYLSGLLLGIGLAFWTTALRPERHVARFRLLTAIVALGGLARLGGLLEHGAPSAPMLFGLAMELLATPALCLWQARIAAAGSGLRPNDRDAVL